MRTFKSYIKAMAKNGTRFSAVALDELNEIAVVIADSLSRAARKIVEAQGRKTISAKSILNAMSLRGDLHVVANSVSYAKRAIRDYKAYNGDKGSRMEAKAGLVVSVSLCRSYIEFYKSPGYRMSEEAPIALAAIVETVLVNIYDLAENAARESNKATISPRHVFLVIYNDEEMVYLLNVLGFTMRTGGAIPNIRSGLVPVDKKHTKTKRTGQGAGIKPPHRFRPGTVSLRQIRKYQRSDENIVTMAASRAIIGSASGAIKRVSKPAHIAIHNFLEDELVSALSDAVTLTLHAGRTTTNGQDVRLAFQLKHRNLFLDQSFNKKEQILKKPELERASYRAGVKRRGGTFFEDASGLIEKLVSMVVSSASRNAVAADRKTIQPEDVRMALDALRLPHSAV